MKNEDCGNIIAVLGVGWLIAVEVGAVVCGKSVEVFHRARRKGRVIDDMEREDEKIRKEKLRKLIMDAYNDGTINFIEMKIMLWRSIGKDEME